MVTFNAADPGTAESTWAADPRLHDRPVLDLTDAAELIVIAAHPDDETLGAGGLITHCANLGIPVQVICVSDGAASHPGQTHLAKTRARELAAALSELAPHATLRKLGFPDGQTRERRAEITATLAAEFEQFSTDAVIAVTWRGDGHRDHRIVGEVTAELAGGRLLVEYPVWMWHWARPDHCQVPWDQMFSLPIDSATKNRGIAQYVSQIGGENPMLHKGFLEHFRRDWEVYIVTENPTAPRNTGHHTLGQKYFDSLYEKTEDPWRFRTRWYEERKRDITIASLPREHYPRALEIGCSIGMLTDLLARRCAQLIAVDISQDAVEQARSRAGSRAHIHCQDVLQEFPSGPFDLVVLSEVGYYWSAQNLRAALKKIHQNLAPGGTVLACHWRHPVADYPLGGDDVHAIIAEQNWQQIVRHLEEDFILEVLSTDPRSVATQEGLI